MDENKKQLEIAPALGIVIILLLVAVAGLFLYKSMLDAQPIATTDVILDVDAAAQDSLVSATATNLELAAIEQELEALTVDISDDDLFGLEQLDAELLDLSGLDEALNFDI